MVQKKENFFFFLFCCWKKRVRLFIFLFQGEEKQIKCQLYGTLEYFNKCLSLKS